MKHKPLRNNHFSPFIHNWMSLKKPFFLSFFVFVISQLRKHPILKIRVSSPHNKWGIMGGRHINFKDWVLIGLRNDENKISKTRFN
jgi:hypothetical protein